MEARTDTAHPKRGFRTHTHTPYTHSRVQCREQQCYVDRERTAETEIEAKTAQEFGPDGRPRLRKSHRAKCSILSTMRVSYKMHMVIRIIIMNVSDVRADWTRATESPLTGFLAMLMFGSSGPIEVMYGKLYNSVGFLVFWSICDDSVIRSENQNKSFC